MAELDELDQSLALAQAGLAAPPGVKERVRAKLAAATMPPEVTPPVGAGSRPSQGAGMPSSALGAARHGVPTWGALALTGLGFVAGYWFAPRPTATPDAQARQTTAVPTKPVSIESPAPSESPHAESLPGNSRVGEEAAPSVEAAAARGELADGAQKARAKARAARRSATPEGLARELALLRRAERAIRAGNAELAVALLDQLDREHPKSQFLQEREAARLLADCERSPQGALGGAARSAASERARLYLGSHPASVYSERIQNLCGLDASAARTRAKDAHASEAQPLAPDGAEGSAERGH
jgi:hypothetical protein